MNGKQGGAFTVSPDGFGWVVAFNAEPVGLPFARFSTAIASARDAAQARWEATGLQTDVIVHDQEDRVFRECRFGPDPVGPAG
jgi:hypothetical protein